MRTIRVSNHERLAAGRTLHWLNHGRTEVIVAADVGVVVAVKVLALSGRPSTNVAFQGVRHCDRERRSRMSFE